MPLVLLLPHFQSLPPLPYVAGSLLATVLVLNPRVAGFEYVLGSCGPFLTNFPQRPAVALASPTPIGFYSQELWDFIFLVLGTLGCAVLPGAHAPGIPNVGPPIPLAAATTWLLPPHHCHTVSSPPWLPIPSPTTHLGSLLKYVFFKSLVVGLPYCSIFWQFRVILVLRLVVILKVVQGGTACLPMPPSLLEVSKIVFELNTFVRDILISNWATGISFTFA